MKFLTLALLSAVPATMAAREMDLSTSNIPATSKLGGRILSKARQLEGGDDYTSWVAGYSIKFHQCVASQDYYGGYFAADGENQYAEGYNGQYYNAEDANNGNYNQNYNNGEQAEGYNGYYNDYDNNRDGYAGIYEQKLVHFKLCPTDSCRSCSGGADYVVDLNEFVEAMIEAKQTATEYNCNRVKDRCYCENASNKDSCLYNCYQNANLGDSCTEVEEDFNLYEALQCKQLEVNDQYKSYNQGQNADMKYYVGPYCSDNGKKILLGVFTEETCSWPAKTGVYESMNYGQSLPYAKKSILDSGCISCKEPSEDNQENYNNYQNQWDAEDADVVTDVCERLYESAGKCEKNLSNWVYKNNMACNFIESLKQPVSLANVPAKVFAGIFGVATVLLGGLSLHLLKKSRRKNVSLVSPEAELA